MPKYLTMLLMFCMFMLLPIKGSALYEGEEINNDIKDEYRITTDDGNLAPDTPISSDEDRDIIDRKPSDDSIDYNPGDNDSIYPIEDDAEILITTTDDGKRLNDDRDSISSIINIIISGIIGILIGSGTTYLIIKKLKN